MFSALYHHCLILNSCPLFSTLYHPWSLSIGRLPSLPHSSHQDSLSRFSSDNTGLRWHGLALTTFNVLVKPSFQAQLLLCTFYLHEQCAWTSILLAPERALYAMVTTNALNCQCHQKPCGPPGNQYPVETCTSMPSLLSLSSCDFTFPLSTCTSNAQLFTLPQCSGKMGCS